MRLILSLNPRKSVIGFPNRTDTNQVVQSQKVTRRLKISDIETKVIALSRQRKTRCCSNDIVNNMSLVVRKLVFGGFDLVRHKPDCSATEDGKRLEILYLGSRGIVRAKTKALICVFVFAYAKKPVFPQRGSYVPVNYPNKWMGMKKPEIKIESDDDEMDDASALQLPPLKDKSSRLTRFR